MKRTIFWLLAALVVSALCLGCDNEAVPNADQQQAKRTEESMAEANRQIGMPGITNYQQRRLMKLIMEECDREDLVCYAYLQSEHTGQLVYLGRCLGYGVPFSAQFTNPERVVQSYSSSFGTLPQPDPNGLFMPTSSDATWVMLLDKEGKPRACYGEPLLFVSPFPLPQGPAVLGGP